MFLGIWFPFRYKIIHEFSIKKRIISAFSVGVIMCLLISVCGAEQLDSNNTTTAGVINSAMVDLSSISASVVESEVISTATASSIDLGDIDYGYTNLGISCAEGNVNIRAEASLEASLVGKLPENAACEIISTDGDWTYISSGEVEGYVYSEYLLTGDEAWAKAAEVIAYTAVVQTDGLRVRLSASTDGTILATLSEGEEYEIIEELDGWVKIEIDDIYGYVSSEYVSCEWLLPDAMTMAEAQFGSGVSSTRASLVNYALQLVGNPYVWGGTSLTNGADCSGFVLSVYKYFGYTLPHSSAAQANCGTRIKTSQLQPGDLIIYGSGSSINHEAIYIGNGKVVHASSKKTGIKTSNYNYRSIICCVRIIND